MKQLKTLRPLAFPFFAALLGAGAVLSWQRYRDANGQSHQEKPIREEFIAAQDLSLTDSAGDPLGRLDVSSGLVTLYLYTDSGGGQSSASVYSDSSRVVIRCAGNADETGIIVDPNRMDISDLKRGYVGGELGVPEWRNSRWHRFRNALLPSDGMRFDNDWILPTEDVRLRSRNGWIFASLGMSNNGEPGIAVADASQNVRIAWFQRRLLDSQWWEIAVFDKSGEMRLVLQLRPGKAPNLVLYANGLPTSDLLDFGTHRFANDNRIQMNTLGWLPAMQRLPQAPIRLQDNRGRVLWSAP
jgi:hypothetical protein